MLKIFQKLKSSNIFFRLAALLSALILFSLLGGISFFLGQKFFDRGKVVNLLPNENTLALIDFSLDPSPSLKKILSGKNNKLLPSWQKLFNDNIDWLMTETTNQSEFLLQESININKKMEWLNKTAHLAFLLEEDLFVQTDILKKKKIAPVVFLSIRNFPAASAYFTSLDFAGEKLNEQDIQGIKIYNFPKSQNLYFFRIGNFLILTSDIKVIGEIITVSKNNKKALASNPDYYRVRSRLPTGDIMVFLNTQLFWQIPSNSKENGKKITEQTNLNLTWATKTLLHLIFSPINFLGLTILGEKEGVRLIATIAIAPNAINEEISFFPKTPKYESTLKDFAPSDTALFISNFNLTGKIKYLSEQLKNRTPALENFFSDSTNLNLQEKTNTFDINSKKNLTFLNWLQNECAILLNRNGAITLLASANNLNENDLKSWLENLQIILDNYLFQNPNQTFNTSINSHKSTIEEIKFENIKIYKLSIVAKNNIFTAILPEKNILLISTNLETIKNSLTLADNSKNALSQNSTFQKTSAKTR